MSDDEDDERPIHTDDPLSRLLWAADALREHKDDILRTGDSEIEDGLVECVDDLVAAALHVVELHEVTRSLTANLRTGWLRTAEENAKLGWPPFSDEVEHPTRLARDLGFVLLALDGGADASRLRDLGISPYGGLGVRLRLLAGEDVPMRDRRRALPEVDEREAAKHRAGCLAGERFRGNARCSCDGRAHLDPRPLELVPHPQPKLELVEVRPDRTSGGDR